MYLNRSLESKIENHLRHRQEIIVVYGARQVGKTTMLQSIIERIGLKSLFINADEIQYHDVLNSRDKKRLMQLVEGYQLIFIDEAQRITNIGINIKIIHDKLPSLKIILSGSSSFDLANKVQEPLTGRTRTFVLFPISFYELKSIYNTYELHSSLQDFMLFGGYPKLLNIRKNSDKKVYLNELISAYLYKDILQLTQIKHADKLYNLLKLIAYQIGQVVSTHELAKSLKLSSETIENYIDLLEKSFVIYRLSGFSKNLRKEVTKQQKIFFYDLGIRNTLINNFSELEFRPDKGQLWENFLIIERLKYIQRNDMIANNYFWRTYTGAELDYVEEVDGTLSGFEFKWRSKVVKAPKTWLETYKNATFQNINSENYFDFII